MTSPGPWTTHFGVGVTDAVDVGAGEFVHVAVKYWTAGKYVGVEDGKG